MTLIIDPPLNAIPVYPWMVVQDQYLAVLETMRVSQAAISADYDFEIAKNRVYPYIEDGLKTQLVNCMLGPRNDFNITRSSRDVHQTFIFEIMARSEDEGSNKAGEIVAERAQYLASMVEYALMALYNNVNGQDPRIIEVNFPEPQEVRKSESLFIFGTVNITVPFALNYADYANLPALTLIQANINGNLYNF